MIWLGWCLGVLGSAAGLGLTLAGFPPDRWVTGLFQAALLIWLLQPVLWLRLLRRERSAPVMDLPPEAFPFTLIYRDAGTGDVIWIRTMTGPGPLILPGIRELGRPTTVTLLKHDGTVITPRRTDDHHH